VHVRLLEALPKMRKVLHDPEAFAPLMIIADMLEAQGAEKNVTALLTQVSKMLPSMAERVGPRLGEVVQGAVGETMDQGYNSSKPPRNFLKFKEGVGAHFENSAGVGHSGGFFFGLEKPVYDNEMVDTTLVIVSQIGYQYKLMSGHVIGVTLRLTSLMGPSDKAKGFKDFRVAIWYRKDEEKDVVATEAKLLNATIKPSTVIKAAAARGFERQKFQGEIEPVAVDVKPGKSKPWKLSLASKIVYVPSPAVNIGSVLKMSKADVKVKWGYWPEWRKIPMFRLRFIFEKR